MSVNVLDPNLTVIRPVNMGQTAVQPQTEVYTDYSQVDCNSLSGGFLGLGGERAKCKQAKGEGFFQNLGDNLNQGAEAVNSISSALNNLLGTLKGAGGQPITPPQGSAAPVSTAAGMLQNPVVILGGAAVVGLLAFKLLKK